jgi:hypothetical protein
MRLEELTNLLRELRDTSEIKDITYQYWYAVDTKNPALLKDVFAPGEILIDYEDCPTWRDRDSFVEFYCSLALDPARQENHFGSSPRIKITGADTAVANWRLNMFAYNFDSRTIMRVTGEYDNGYSRVLGRWKIRSSVFKRHSLFAESVGQNGHLSAPDFGGISPDAHAHLYGKEAEETAA